MTTAEELRALANTLAVMSWSGAAIETLSKAASELESLAEDKARLDWIENRDELPDDEITVLLAVQGGDDPVILGYHVSECTEQMWFRADNSAGVGFDDNGDPTGAKVTHWAHLPDPPTA